MQTRSVCPWLMFHLRLYNSYSFTALVKKLCFLPVFWYQCIRTFCSYWTLPVKRFGHSFSCSSVMNRILLMVIHIVQILTCFFFKFVWFFIIFFFCGGAHFGIENCGILVVWVILLMRPPQGLEASLRLFQPLLGFPEPVKAQPPIHSKL